MRSADGRFEYRAQDETPLPPGTPMSGVHRVAFRCRREPDARWWCAVNVKGRGHDIEKKDWTLTGTLDAPTLAPSINCANCWHGFIEAGVFLNVSKKPEAVQ